MTQYTAIAAVYDRLQDPGFYTQYAERVDVLLGGAHPKPKLVLDLGCGTGSLCLALGQLGYDMIGCDISVPMLSIAQEKCCALPSLPLFLNQDMRELDLYGTIDAALCSMDGINYLTRPADLGRVFSRVSLFLNPGGLFIFDVKTPALFRSMDGLVSVDEDEDYYCVWQYGFSPKTGHAQHHIDLFFKRDRAYCRFTEVHEQRAYSRQTLEELLTGAGFTLAGVWRGLSDKRARTETGRLLFVAQKQRMRKY